MQIGWLDELVKEGQVRPEVRDGIVGDCLSLVKKASATAGPGGALPRKVLVNSLLSGLAGAAGTSLWQKIHEGGRTRATINAIDKTREDVLKDPAFAGHADKAEARFNEIVQLAPGAGTNKVFMKRLIERKLHSGLSSDDVYSLALMHANYGQSGEAVARKIQKTAAAAEADLARDASRLADRCLLLKEAGILSFRPDEKHVNSTKNLLGGWLLGAAITGVTGAAVGGYNMYANKKSQKELEARHRETFEEALRRADRDTSNLHENRDKAWQAFQTLAHFAPHMAVEPNAAKTFMQKVVAYDNEVDPSLVKDVTDIERNIRSTKGPGPMESGVSAAAKTIGLAGVLNSGMRQYYTDVGLLKEKEKGSKPGAPASEGRNG